MHHSPDFFVLHAPYESSRPIPPNPIQIPEIPAISHAQQHRKSKANAEIAECAPSKGNGGKVLLAEIWNSD